MHAALAAARRWRAAQLQQKQRLNSEPVGQYLALPYREVSQGDLPPAKRPRATSAIDPTGGKSAASVPPSPDATCPVKTPQQLRDELGYIPCGINNCILQDRHKGPCLFEFAQGKRSRGKAKTFSPFHATGQGRTSYTAQSEAIAAAPAPPPAPAPAPSLAQQRTTVKPTRRGFRDDEVSTLLRMRGEGASLKEVADTLGRCVSGVCMKWQALQDRNLVPSQLAERSSSFDVSPNASPDASPASARPHGAAFGSSHRCTAAECCMPGTRTHPQLKLPLCEAHADQFEMYDHHSWPTDELGDDDVCQWCCGISTAGSNEPPDSEIVLCHDCGMAWCNLCIARNLGAAYWEDISCAEEEEPWRCPYCDVSLLQRVEERQRRRTGGRGRDESAPAESGANPTGAPALSRSSSHGATTGERQPPDAGLCSSGASSPSAVASTVSGPRARPTAAPPAAAQAPAVPSAMARLAAAAKMSVAAHAPASAQTPMVSKTPSAAKAQAVAKAQAAVRAPAVNNKAPAVNNKAPPGNKAPAVNKALAAAQTPVVPKLEPPSLTEPTLFNNAGNPVSGSRSGVNAQHAGVNGPHSGVNGPRAGVNGPRPGVNGQHSGVNGQHTGVNGPHTGVNGRRVKLSTSDDEVTAAPPYEARQEEMSHAEVERLRSEVAFLRAALAQKGGS